MTEPLHSQTQGGKADCDLHVEINWLRQREDETQCKSVATQKELCLALSCHAQWHSKEWLVHQCFLFCVMHLAHASFFLSIFHKLFNLLELIENMLKKLKIASSLSSKGQVSVSPEQTIFFQIKIPKIVV